MTTPLAIFHYRLPASTFAAWRAFSLVHHVLIWAKMRRALHIAISVMAVVLLLRPFECFAAGTPRSGDADCCLKGKCAPTANSDACCRNSTPVRDQFVPLKANEHVSPLIVIAATYAPLLVPDSTRRALTGPVRHPPPRGELIPASLPLLI